MARQLSAPEQEDQGFESFESLANLTFGAVSHRRAGKATVGARSRSESDLGNFFEV
jgi:hypothetical protein